jgi:manganese transport protein
MLTIVKSKSETVVFSRSPSQVSRLNASVPTDRVRGWRRFFAFSGPAYLVSVGYMDPGNWAADLEAGSRFGYQLLWVLMLSNLLAILLQTLSARLGIATGRDLAQSCREHYPKHVNYALWALCEIAIAACDLAEVLGTAIALKLLFGLPLLWGVAITVMDTFLILSLSRYGIRLLERVVLGMIAVIGACIAAQLFLARPDLTQVASGLVPRLSGESLYIAIAMLGATVMPHNLYLHSALVQTRAISGSAESKREASHFNFLDSATALTAALFVNAGILVLAAAVFHARGVEVTGLEQAYELLAPLLGSSIAATFFATALLASGQSSTFTGTFAGQIVMEGFLNLRMRPWLRQLITRMVAIVPAAVVIAWLGESQVYPMLIFSQVLLSLQLPFAIVPLVHFTSDRAKMGALANSLWLKIAAWATAAFVVMLNVWLAFQTLDAQWLAILGLPLGALLTYVVFEPRFRRKPAAESAILPEVPAVIDPASENYRTILVPLDHSEMDRVALGHALALAKSHRARLILLHVEEGAASQVYGELAGTAEEREGTEYLRGIQERLAREDVESLAIQTSSRKPAEVIVAQAREHGADLVVMGAHGHKGLKDLLFGSTINAVRHKLSVPVLVIRRPNG